MILLFRLDCICYTRWPLCQTIYPSCDVLSVSSIDKPTVSYLLMLLSVERPLWRISITKILTTAKTQFSIRAKPLCTFIKTYIVSLTMYLILWKVPDNSTGDWNPYLQKNLAWWAALSAFSHYPTNIPQAEFLDARQLLPSEFNFRS